MKVAVITLFPEMFTALTGHGVSGRAIDRRQLELSLWDPRDYTRDRHRTVDDRPYGGGPGMLMMYQPLHEAIDAARTVLPAGARVIALGPQGRRLDQDGVSELAAEEALVLIAGRYEGIDERLIEADVDEEWSIGDYVLSGGELAAMVMLDAIIRQLPGVLGHAQSAIQDSFYDGLLDCPHYTRPEVVDGREVPAVLLSGDHQAIARWRLQQALGRTWQRRPDLLERMELTAEQRALLEEYIGAHAAGPAPHRGKPE